MQPALPRFAGFADAVAESQRDFGGAWDDDLEPFVEARVVDDGGAYVLTLTAAARLELLRGLYDSQPEMLWPRVDVPAVALLARDGPASISSWKEHTAALLGEVARKLDNLW